MDTKAVCHHKARKCITKALIRLQVCELNLWKEENLAWFKCCLRFVCPLSIFLVSYKICKPACTFTCTTKHVKIWIKEALFSINWEVWNPEKLSLYYTVDVLHRASSVKFPFYHWSDWSSYNRVYFLLYEISYAERRFQSI